jgi:hypothetical protein
MLMQTAAPAPAVFESQRISVAWMQQKTLSSLWYFPGSVILFWTCKCGLAALAQHSLVGMVVLRNRKSWLPRCY